MLRWIDTHHVLLMTGFNPESDFNRWLLVCQILPAYPAAVGICLLPAQPVFVQHHYCYALPLRLHPGIAGQPQQALYDVSGQLFLRLILDSHHLHVCRQRAAYTAAYVTAAALLLSAALHHYAQPKPADHGSTGTCFLGPLFHRPCKPSVKNFLLVPHIL